MCSEFKWNGKVLSKQPTGLDHCYPKTQTLYSLCILYSLKLNLRIKLSVVTLLKSNPHKHSSSRCR